MKLTRRSLLAGAADAVALFSPAAAQTKTDPTGVRVKPPSAGGQRLTNASVQRLVRGATSSGTSHHDLFGIITPSDRHFERHHGGRPRSIRRRIHC